MARSLITALLRNSGLAAAWLAATLALASPQTVHLYSGVPRGGFGDIASNLLMAEKVHERMPEASVTFVVDPEAQDAIRVLVPGYDPAKTDQMIGGIRFVPISQSLPAADLALGFSLDGHNGMPDRILRNARYSLTYKEYGMPDYDEIFEHTQLVSGSIGPPNGHFTLRTGATTSGLYISAQPPRPPLDRSQVHRYLRALDPSLPPLEDLHLGFAYTADGEVSLAYVDGVVKSAKSIPEGKTAVLVVPESVDLGTRSLPKNVRVVRASKIPFQMTRSMIAHSDLPVMVTGDVSMTLAIDYGKPFFYELNFWKEASIRQVVDALGPGLSERMLLDWRQATSIPPRKARAEDSDSIARLIEDPDFSKRFASRLGEVRSSLSLPSNLERQYEFVQELFLIRPGNESLRDLFLLFQKLEDPKKVYPELVSRLQKATRGADVALAARDLLALNELARHPEHVDLIISKSIAHCSEKERGATAARIAKRLKFDAGFAELVSSLEQGAKNETYLDLITESRQHAAKTPAIHCVREGLKPILD